MPGKSEFHIGIASIAAAVFLILIGIPQWVTAPSNVRNIVLSPTFWPYVLAGLLGLVGAGLLLASRTAEPANDESLLTDSKGGVLRLAAVAGLMVAYVALIPVLGMVWSSMLAFGAVAALVHTRHPIAAAIAAVLVPLALYAFFAHVASVAVPQGELVRLP